MTTALFFRTLSEIGWIETGEFTDIDAVILVYTNHKTPLCVARRWEGWCR